MKTLKELQDLLGGPLNELPRLPKGAIPKWSKRKIIFVTVGGLFVGGCVVYTFYKLFVEKPKVDRSKDEIILKLSDMEKKFTEMERKYALAKNIELNKSPQDSTKESKQEQKTEEPKSPVQESKAAV